MSKEKGTVRFKRDRERMALVTYNGGTLSELSWVSHENEVVGLQSKQEPKVWYKHEARGNGGIVFLIT